MENNRAVLYGVIMSQRGSLEQKIRTKIRRLGMSYHTEENYVGCYKRFVKFHDLRHPSEMAEKEVEAFLNHLAMNLNVSKSTQNQSFSALTFLFREVLEKPLEGLNARRARVKRKLPVVLAKDEVRELLASMDEGTPRVMGQLLYGCGLRVSEGLRLRIKDVDFSNEMISIRQGKGDKDRAVTLPKQLKGALEREVAKARVLYEQDEADPQKM